MALDSFIGALRSLWGLWVMIFFCGAVLWAYRPAEAQMANPQKNNDNEER